MAELEDDSWADAAPPPQKRLRSDGQTEGGGAQGGAAEGSAAALEPEGGSPADGPRRPEAPAAAPAAADSGAAAELEDDSWADGPSRPRAEAAPAKAKESPRIKAREAELDDYWVDGPRRSEAAPVPSRPREDEAFGTGAAPELEDDRWADGPFVRRPATKAWNKEPKVPPPGAAELEDDSWADGPLRSAAAQRHKEPVAKKAARKERIEANAEDTTEFIGQVLELMLQYEPPADKRPSVMNRHLPEPFWVPAMDILNSQQQTRLEACVDDVDSIETCLSDTEGLLLRVARHPRAADDVEHLDQCVVRLSKDLEISEEEARGMLNADAKFMQFWGALRIVEAASKEEAHLERTLRARTKILTDARRLSARVTPPAPWAAMRDGLEKVRRYRQVLSAWLAASNQEAEEQLQACLDVIVEAWPDVKSVDGDTKNSDESKAQPGKGKAGKGKGKGKDKGKGKSKGKGKGKKGKAKGV